MSMKKFAIVNTKSGKIMCPVCGQEICGSLDSEKDCDKINPCKHIVAFYTDSIGEFCFKINKKVKNDLNKLIYEKEVSAINAFKHYFKYDDDIIVRRFNGPYLGGCQSDRNIAAFRIS